ncbi:MAG: DUF1178 family protein [Caldimonas sp.]
MKVLNLRCVDEHGFEGWFASEDDFVAQSARGAVACPLCGSKSIDRLPSAPRIQMSRQGTPAPEPSSSSMPVTLQSQWLRAVRHVMASTEDVGERFAEEARRIHYGEVEERGIRGRASREDAQALRDEGIDVMALPVPDALKGPVQ